MTAHTDVKVLVQVSGFEPACEWVVRHAVAGRLTWWARRYGGNSPMFSLTFCSTVSVQLLRKNVLMQWLFCVKIWYLNPHCAAQRLCLDIYFNYLIPSDIWVGKLRHIIGSDNGLSAVWCQASIWTKVGLLFIEPLRIDLSEIWIKIHRRKWIRKCLQNAGHSITALFVLKPEYSGMRAGQWHAPPGAHFTTWINFNPSMDK